MRFLILLFLASVSAQAESDILARLNALPGVQAVENTSADDASKKLRKFAVTVEQPVDHFNPRSPKFRQKIVLFHRDLEEPMVLQTSGYNIFSERLSRLAAVFGTNQIQVEHRFFGESVPEGKDWSKLTVRQSAEDFHRIVEIFRREYKARWVSTGASKGGMTSFFHRRFYPRDLDGTVADVAPFSYAVDDQRYVEFVDKVGGIKYADCRRKLYNLQAVLLRRGAEILPSIGDDYSQVGDKRIAYEQAVVELPFTFWQYGNPDGHWGCANIPGESDSAETLTNFLLATNTPGNYNNSSMSIFQPYYFQAAVELGGPGAELGHLRNFLQFPYVMDPLLPKGVAIEYSNRTLLDMRDWATREARGVMFIYGEFDPWTAGAFPAINTRAGADNYLYVIPGDNHGANFTALSGKQKEEAIATLTRWFGKAPMPRSPEEALFRAFRSTDDSLEAHELAIRRARGL